MKIVQPINIDFARPYPPWQLRIKNAVLCQVNPSDGHISIIEVRPSMVSKKDLLGWAYKFSGVFKGDGTAVKEVDLSVVCLFQHGPIVIREKTLYDIDLKESRILIKGKNNWWQLDENETISESNFVSSLDKKGVYAIQFVIINKHTGKPTQVHTTTRQSSSQEF